MVKPRQHQILYEDEGNGAAVYDFYVGRSLTAPNLYLYSIAYIAFTATIISSFSIFCLSFTTDYNKLKMRRF